MSKIFISLFLIFMNFSSLYSSSEKHYVLIVGGAGFIGSHVNEMLYRQGYQTIVFDNLSQGDKKNVQHGIFIEGDLKDEALLNEIFTRYTIDAVMHFAAFKDVGESMNEPLKYYQNNVGNTLNLLSAMLRHGVNRLIFSSSAAVFGIPREQPITENHPCHPINPYGQSKLMVENILKDLDRTGQLRFCSLRYFNAAGGDPEGKLKNFQLNNSNLIPIVLNHLTKSNPTITIYGTDYLTPDGTCIRDFIHIDDIGSAHILAMEKLLNGGPSCCYNLGNGQGFSVRDVIATIEKVTGRNLTIKEGKRREGDPAALVASAKKAREELQWIPRYSSLETIIEHAWESMPASLELLNH